MSELIKSHTCNLQKSSSLLQKCKNFKWFGLTLVPFSMRYADQLTKLATTHLFHEGVKQQSSTIALAYPEGIFLVRDCNSNIQDEIIGCHAFLPLSQYGLQLIEFGLFDGADIESDALASNFKDAIAIYWWTSIAPGKALKSVTLVNLILERDDYSGKPIFAKAATQRGLLAMKGLGFKCIDKTPGKIGKIFSLNYLDEEIV